MTNSDNQDSSENLLSTDASEKKTMSKRAKGYLIAAIVLTVLAIIFLVLLCLKPHFETMVDNLVHKEVQFTDDNADVWAEFPGKNDIIIVNNITFLNHRNMGSRFIFCF
jgi:riboflavin transporter FmnP